MTSGKFLDQYDYLLFYRDTSGYREGARSAYPEFPRMNAKGIYFPDLNPYARHSKLMKMIRKLYYPFIALYELVVLYFLFLKEKTDIVHINNGGYPGAASCRMAAIAARLAGKRNIVFSVNNMAEARTGFSEIFVDFFVHKNVSIFVTGSKASKAALENNRGFRGEKITNIYHGINTDFLPQRNADNSGNGYAVMVARFEERKGHKYAVMAFKKLLHENRELSGVKLIFLGEGPIFGEVKEFVSKEGLDENIVFLGHRNDRIDYVSKSLFLLLPSSGYEDLPFAILEAMATGIPAIGTNVAGIPEEIENGVTGIVVPPNDTQALAEAMRVMFSDSNKRDRMGAAAKARFNSLFTVDKMVNNYLALYNKLA